MADVIFTLDTARRERDWNLKKELFKVIQSFDYIQWLCINFNNTYICVKTLKYVYISMLNPIYSDVLEEFV